MNSIERKLKITAIDAGAAVVGIGSRDRLADAPPSGDPGYILPSTASFISFAIPFDRQRLRDYFGKRAWRAFGDDQKKILQTLYRISDALVALLDEAGHQALTVDANCVYRAEKGADHLTDLTEFVPDFSHQYGAVAAGLGRLGLSGNLLTPEHGAAVLLGTVLTSAVLEPDPLCEENPCDRCGICTVLCPVKMMDPKKTVSAGIAGVVEEIAARRPHSCCWIGCGDYHGLSADGTWSNWSPYRVDYPLPSEKNRLDGMLVELRKADPESYARPNPYTDYRAVTFDPDWSFSATCGNCANVCWKNREDREENKRLVIEGGVVVLNADGTRQATREETVELATQFGSRVAVSLSQYRKLKAGSGARREFRGHLSKDKKVLEYLAEHI